MKAKKIPNFLFMTTGTIMLIIVIIIVTINFFRYGKINEWSGNKNKDMNVSTNIGKNNEKIK